MGLVSLGACVAGFVLDFIFGDPVGCIIRYG